MSGIADSMTGEAKLGYYQGENQGFFFENRPCARKALENVGIAFLSAMGIDANLQLKEVMVKGFVYNSYYSSQS